MTDAPLPMTPKSSATPRHAPPQATADTGSPSQEGKAGETRRRDLPDDLAGLLRRRIGELEVHVEKENLIAVMRMGQTCRDIAVAQIIRSTKNFSLPERDFGTWAQPNNPLAEHGADLADPMHLEIGVLIPQFEPRCRASTGDRPLRDGLAKGDRR